MEENQNGWNTNEAPRTYGEDSKLYENGRSPYEQPGGGGQTAYGNNQSNYGAGQNAYGNNQGNYGAGQNAYGNNQGNYGAGQNAYGNNQENYGAGQNAYGNNQGNYGAGQNPYGQPGGGQTYENNQSNYGNGQGYGNGQPNYGAGQNPYSQPGYGGQGYGQNPYGYQPNGNWQGNIYPQMQHAPVPDVFCNILIAIYFVRMVLSFFIMRQTYAAMDDYYSIISGRYLNALMGSSYQALSAVANLLFVAMIIFVVLDIVKIHKANYKITGLILFAIFLNPGYYLWRAHILGRKKTFPIIYTVIYGGAMIVYFIYTFYKAFSLTFQMTQMLY